MSNYFEFVSRELLSKLEQVKQYITRHNQTIGILTEEILREFLRNHLPKIVSIEQGFILNSDGAISKQCDILIYDSQAFAPFYRVNDIVVIPSEAVIAIIEVKTTISKQIFHSAIDYFKSLGYLENTRKYLFIFNSSSIEKINSYLHSYKHKGSYQYFDHDTFHHLPDEITGINSSFHLKKDYVITDRDALGYTSWFYEDSKGTEINAIQHFYLSLYQQVETYIDENYKKTALKQRATYHEMSPKFARAIELFDM